MILVQRRCLFVRHEEEFVQIVETRRLDLRQAGVGRLCLSLNAKIMRGLVHSQNHLALEWGKGDRARINGRFEAKKKKRHAFAQHGRGRTVLSVMQAPRASADMSHRLSLLQLSD